jgi:HEAT repeat protein
MGESAVPLLFRALCDCPTRSGRQELCDLLEALKEATRRFLAAELEKRAIPWYFQRNLLNLMGRVGGAGSLPLVARFLTDKHPRVRLEAMLATCALDAARAERVLLAGLADEDPDIRAVSLRQLVQRRSSARELFAHFQHLLGRPEEVGLELALQACNLLTCYQSGDGRERAVDLLLEVLGDGPQKGFWSRLAGDQNTREVLKAAACQALGRLQAARAAHELARLAEGKDKALRSAAVHALRVIQAASASGDHAARPPLAPRPS